MIESKLRAKIHPADDTQQGQNKLYTLACVISLAKLYFYCYFWLIKTVVTDPGIPATSSFAVLCHICTKF